MRAPASVAIMQPVAGAAQVCEVGELAGVTTPVHERDVYESPATV